MNDSPGAEIEPIGPRIELPDIVTDLNLPRLRNFAAMLRFAPLDGSIWMGDRRMVLLHAEAFASLRNELIASLGIDMARGLLTRIGYAAGCRDAELACKSYSGGDSMAELLGSGSALHGLFGFVRVERVRSRATHPGTEHDAHFEWIWRNSIEDEGHVSAHGVGSHAACWLEVGYSSGYLSTCTGRRILVREVECRALGHGQCRAIAKPVSMWEDAEEDLRFLEPQAQPPRRFFGGMEATDAATPAPAAGAAAIVGASPAFNVLRHHVLRVAPTNATVLLLGESGVGKSALARELHRHSRRAAAPLVEVNCAAIPEQLVESELFGVERGAFSGASHSRPGRFEIANAGTLFLDEIATLSLTAQGKLLRVLQSGELERLGSTRTLATDVRVIAATNENLAEAVKDGRFREDLYFRLNVFPLRVPPLRERRDDIPLLTEVILERFAQRHGRRLEGITARAMQMLLQQPWPGNIRELENVLERGVILSADGERLDVHHLFSIGEGPASEAMPGLSVLPGAGALPERGPEEVAPAAVAHSPATLERLAGRMLAEGSTSLAEVEAGLVRAALAQAEGNVTRAAGLLGLTRAQMDYRVKKLAAAG